MMQSIAPSVTTITILDVATPLPHSLQVGLGYAAAPHWSCGGKLFIFHCTLADAAILCNNAGNRHFLWGYTGAPLGKYNLRRDKAEFAGHAVDETLPCDLMDHAPPILHRQAALTALEENRTFLSRGQFRRTAFKG